MNAETFTPENLPIGQLPRGWGTTKVDGDLVDILGGFSCARTQTVSSGVPHLRPMNIAGNGEVVITPDTQYIRPNFRDDLATYYLEPGDVLYNNTNSVELVGKSAIVREPMVVAFSNHINRLRVKDRKKTDPKWLALALRYLQAQGFFATHSNRWIGQAGFSVSALADVAIPIPYPENPVLSLIEQRRIVARIEALFAELREGQIIHQAIVADTNRLMDAVLADLFPSPNDAMPVGWVMTRIKDIAGKPQYGYTQSANPSPVGPKFLRITDIQNNTVNWDLVPYCECTARDLDRYRLETNDIVFARSGATTGKTYLISEPPEAVFASYLIRLKVHGAVPSFVHWFFQSPHYWRQIVPRGGAQPNMNATLLQEVKVPLPKDREQQTQISARLDSVHSELASMQELNKQDYALLQDIEQAILAQAFRGEL